VLRGEKKVSYGYLILANDALESRQIGARPSVAVALTAFATTAFKDFVIFSARISVRIQMCLMQLFINLSTIR
jgi:hypothetical protein